MAGTEAPLCEGIARRQSLGRLSTALALALSIGCGDAEIIRKSQRAAVEQSVGQTEIEIEYSRPVARGRVLFGGIVKYGHTWNPGADQATAVSFSKDVRVNGEHVAAGKYSIWMIPDTSRWTFILSRAANVFHTPYPEGRDALRLRIVPRKGAHMETLAFYFPVVDSTRAELVMHWGETVIPLVIVADG